MKNYLSLATLVLVFGVISAVAKEPGKRTMENLISDLKSDDGARRIEATAEIFRRGKAVLPDLKKAGRVLTNEAKVISVNLNYLDR